MDAWLSVLNKWLEWPLGWICYGLGWAMPSGAVRIAYKVAVLAVLALLLLDTALRVRRRIIRLVWKRSFSEEDSVERPEKERPAHIDMLEAARDVERVVEPLKKAKSYGRVAEVYASVNKPAEAAAWYEKAGDRKAAAQQWALAGKTRKAAALLLKDGEYAAAGRFLDELKRYGEAAAAYEQAGDYARAAAAHARAGKTPRAAQMYTEYFAETHDAPQQQWAVADVCYAAMQNELEKQTLPPDVRQTLFAALASRFEEAERYETAAQLFLATGQGVKAGEVFGRMGRFQEAARCMQDAGRMREARLFLARHSESAGRWEEAAKVYSSLGEHRLAGDAYAKARNLAAAGAAYEKAGESYLAAAAYAAARLWSEAARLAALVTATDVKYGAARTLLGQAYFEMGDYPRAAQTLDELLSGKWIDGDNVALFYALGVAWESSGQFEKACDVYRKVQLFNGMYKDVAARLARCGAIDAGPPSSDSWASDFENRESGDPVAMHAVQDIVGARYHFDRELGRGGMGVIYLARDLQLDRLVAIKFLGSLIEQSDEYRERFVREAKAAAKVSHPNIVAIYDIDAAPGRAHLVMEYVVGPNLRAYIRDKGRLSAREAIHFASQIANALDAIHKAGLVHRDIKPDNILLDKAGAVKLTDFGLAKLEQARITQPNVRMGTPAYMAPEQAETSDVDGRADLYSLGLVLHEMLTGKPVFPDEAEDRGSIVVKPPSATVTGVPPALDAAILTCLAKSPEDRFQSAAALLAALRKVSL